VGTLPIKLVAPITDWKPRFAPNIWHVRVAPTTKNGLTKTSAIDVLQIRGMDIQRFARRLGVLADEEMESVVLATTAVIEGR
jgi:mRNA interferase MazF